jgi:uncharacterized protein with PQ loop repeat
MNLIDGIGLTSAILVSVMFVPQVLHVYKEGDTNAINYSFLGLNMAASTMGLAYSINYHIVPMIIANTSAGLFSVSLIGFKYINEFKGEPRVIDEVGV